MTKAQRHMALVQSLGCIICCGPAEVHHILRNGRRINHNTVLPLCYLHHRSGRNDDECVSRHPWHRAFEERYGSEAQLLEMTQERLKVAA